MKTLLFATGNQHKFDAVAAALAARLPNLTLRRLDVDLPEIQSTDPRDVLAAKVAEARKRTAFPVMVDDSSCVIAGTDGFPGALTKHVVRSLGADGLRRAFPEGADITVRCDIALAVDEELLTFSGEVEGVVRHAAADGPAAAMPLNNMVELPAQGKMLGDIGVTTHRMKAINALADWVVAAERAAEAETRETALRWTERSTAWEDTIADPGSYVNHEDGYARFDAVAKNVLAGLDAPTCIDVGCGTGAVARLLAENGAASVLGVDVSDGMVAEEERASQGVAGVAYRTAMPAELPTLGTYDLIVSRGVVLSHLPQRGVLDHLQALDALAKAGSHLVLDFIQQLDNGGFENAGNKNELTYERVVAILRELGWVPIAKDGGPGTRVVVAAFHKPFPDSLYFVTGNPQKLRELRHVANLPHLHGCDFDLPELKHDDIRDIAEDKARQAYEIVRRPVVCTDGGIFLDALGGFPGPNSKHAAKKLGPAGLLKLVAGCSTRRGARINAVSWYDGAEMRTMAHEVPIELAEAPAGDYPSYPLDKVLVPVSPANPDGKTYAEMPVEDRVPFTELPELARFVRECATR